jgi:hypothetical protein
MLKETKSSGKIKIDPSLSNKYKGTTLFKDKFDWAVNHIKDRDVEKEIMEALKKERITKP